MISHNKKEVTEGELTELTAFWHKLGSFGSVELVELVALTAATIVASKKNFMIKPQSVE
jgi:hypothetical protein